MSPRLRPICVLFADIVGSTGLYRQVGDEQAERAVGACLARVSDTAARHAGRQVKTIGDAVMCVFDDAAAAASASVEIQQESRTPVPDAGRRLQLRVAFAAGDAVERDGDYFGDVVNIAARLSDMAKGGQILTTEATSLELPDTLRRAVRLFDRTPVKGISEPIAVVQLVWDQRAHTEILGGDNVIGAMKLSLRYRGTELHLSPADLPFVVGRESGCNLVVDAPFASRRHVRIEYRRGKFVLVDESTNGTYVAYGEKEAETAYLRNEPFTLFASGRLWLGSTPGDDDALLEFSTE